MTQQQTQQGFSLLLAIIISSVVLAIGLSLLNITMKQLDLSSTARDSEIAFQAAVAGMECAQAIRWTQASEILSDGNVVADCAEEEIRLEDTVNLTNKQYYKGEFDWKPTGEPERCINIEMLVINSSATGGGRNFPSKLNDRGISGSCPEGVNCTVAVVQGYSTDCTTKDDPDAFAVQRELTAEF